MAKATPKIVLSASRDIPFDKLILSQSNVRRVKAGVSITELAEDIARRGLLQSLSVRPIQDGEGQETGMFEAPVGGRRYRALELLAKQKRFPNDGPVPCVVKGAHDPISAEEDSLAENSFREPLHPLDEFRGMQKLADQGQGEEEIAVHFNTTATVVKQRLRLASVSPTLHEIYAEDGMTLEQLIAFSVNEDHVRQEAVWELLAHSWNKTPAFIRQKLTENTVHASDRRVLFVGVDAYIAAGGVVMRDLFEPDDGGWLNDPAMLDRLVDETLKTDGERICAEGWKWVVASIDLPYGCANGLRELDAVETPLTEAEQARADALAAETEALELEYDSADELPEAVEARLQAIDEELASLEERPWTYDPAQMARAGVFVSLGADGVLRIDRGFVRPEDEPAEEPAIGVGVGADGHDIEADADGDGGAMAAKVHQPTIAVDGPTEESEDTVLKPVPDGLVTELTAQRTLALQDAFALTPATAFAAVLHALALSAFYQTSQESCLGLSVSSVSFLRQPSDMRESPSAKAIAARHASWKAHLPKSDKDLWEALQAFSGDEQAALFAHCAAFAVNAVWEAVGRYDTGRISSHTVARRVAHADVLACAVGLDMVAVGWRPTVVNYLGRVTKAHILQAVTEGKDEQAAGLIDHLRKDDMAREAERLLADAGWLPEPLRTPTIAKAKSAAVDPVQPDAVEDLPVPTDEPDVQLAADEQVETAAYAHAAE
jgi:ParB family chromosome partitioning protein